MLLLLLLLLLLLVFEKTFSVSLETAQLLCTLVIICTFWKLFFLKKVCFDYFCKYSPLCCKSPRLHPLFKWLGQYYSTFSLFRALLFKKFKGRIFVLRFLVLKLPSYSINLMLVVNKLNWNYLKDQNRKKTSKGLKKIRVFSSILALPTFETLRNGWKIRNFLKFWLFLKRDVCSYYPSPKF